MRKSEFFQDSTCLSDLVTSDYKIFPKIKEKLRGHHFYSDDVITAVNQFRSVLLVDGVNVGKYVEKINIKGLQQIPKHL